MPERNPAMTNEMLRAPVFMQSWATPRKSSVGMSRVLTRRTCTDLSTQIRFEKRTPDHLRNGYVNPNWIEWLQGFPKDWTRLTPKKEIPKPRTKPQSEVRPEVKPEIKPEIKPKVIPKPPREVKPEIKPKALKQTVERRPLKP
jgi:hypothetical protein